MTKVLIADDSMFMRANLKAILTKNGYEVVGEAGDGLQAVESFEALSPDIVTLDITMPRMNGLEALREIKKINPAVKVIMCSAMGQQSIVDEAVSLGASDFIQKPFKASDVIETIEKVLS